MRGMRQIAGELAMGAAMALGAGSDDMIPAKVGARISHREDVMGPVAVVTLGGFEAA